MNTSINFNNVTAARFNSKHIKKIRFNGKIIYSDAKAGLYDLETGARIYSWNYLVENGYFTVSDGVILKGTNTARFNDLVGELYIPETITRIGNADISTNGDAPFYGLKGLQKVNIPSTVTYIGHWAFNNSGLTTMTLPDSVTTAYDSAFSDCESLEYFDFGNSITTVSRYVLESCSKLKFVRLSPKTKYIEPYSFNYDGALMSIYIPKSVTSISGGTDGYPYAPFYKCSSNLVIYFEGKYSLPGEPDSISNTATNRLELKTGYTYDEYIQEINLPRPVTFTYGISDFSTNTPTVSNTIEGTAIDIRGRSLNRANNDLYNLVMGSLKCNTAEIYVDIAIATSSGSIVIDTSNTNFTRIKIPKEYIFLTSSSGQIEMPLSTPIALADGGVAQSIKIGWYQPYSSYARLLISKIHSSNGTYYPVKNMRIAEFNYTKE